MLYLMDHGIDVNSWWVFKKWFPIFRFPSNIAQRKAWLSVFNFPEDCDLKDSRICSNHFDEHCFTVSVSGKRLLLHGPNQ